MLSTVRTYASFVKLSHTVFALPFAIAGMVAAYAVPTIFVEHLEFIAGEPIRSYAERSGAIVDELSITGPMKSITAGYAVFDWRIVGLIVICMVGARSFAMAVNRILDRKIDALNPRTARRELPAGVLSVGAAWAFAVCSAALYFGACWVLGEVVLWLSPIPVTLMLVYPFTKRFTAFCHLVLGASLGLAPVGAWVAVRSAREATLGLGWGAVGEPAPWLLGAAVMLWVAGFDVIYALQDDAFDREHRLHSIPAALGRDKALWVSRLMHVLSAALFFVFIYVLTHPAPLGAGTDVSQYTRVAQWVWASPCVMLGGMVYQHALVKPNDLSRVNVAFFTVNGVISVVFGAIFVAAWLLA